MFCLLHTPVSACSDLIKIIFTIPSSTLYNDCSCIQQLNLTEQLDQDHSNWHDPAPLNIFRQ
jgi:hypothetical protein